MSNAPLQQRQGVFEERAFTRPQANQTISCQILIVGGSTAAYSAALVTARAGLNVCLVQPTHILGGQFTTQALPASDDGDLLKHLSHTGVTGEQFAISKFQRQFRDRQRQLQPVQGKVVSNPGGGWVGLLCTSPIVAATALNEAIAPHLQAGNLKFIPHAEPTRILTESGGSDRKRVTGVVFHDHQRNLAFTVQARIVIEATDLGDVLELGQIESRIGQETRSQTGEAALPERALPECQQSFTFGAIVELTPPGNGVPIGAPAGYNRNAWLLAHQFEDRFWIKSGGKWEAARHFLDPFGIFRYRRLIRSATHENSVTVGDVTVLNWGQHQHGETGEWLCGNDYRVGELVGVSREERKRHLKQARDRARAYVHFLQQRGNSLKPRGDLSWTADGIGLEPYIREARRGVALTTIRHEDVAKHFFPGQARARTFDDSVGIGQYHYLDLHGNDRQGHASLPGDKVIALPFSLPLGALVPIHTDGLVLSAKSIGTTHITNAAYRMHPMEWAIGEASGYLAALSIWMNVQPRAIATQEALTRKLQGLLTRNHIPIVWFDDVAHDDKDFEAIQVLAAAGIIRSESHANLHFHPQTTVNRAVVVTALLNLLNIPPKVPAAPTFVDVPPDHWAYANVEAMVAEGFVAGVGDRQFAPNRPISREQLSFLVKKAMPEAYDRAFATVPTDRTLLLRRELSRVFYELLKTKLKL
ncbi:FAD-dependent oxidoreductase [Leptolyngbya sp. AN02str]|uniref:FAD-dependent oxidoreductase n=1 Tax=Leptolyngbya sp. AN02str TaxID=3423363 RepID=UPI003D315411